MYPQEAPIPAGVVLDGRFVDQRWGFSLPVPSGWTASPGPDAGSLRVQLVDALTGTRVEIWAFLDLGQQPRPRADCPWTWIGTGHFRVLDGAEPPGSTSLTSAAVTSAALTSAALTSATCTPEDPEAARVHAWLLPGEGVGYQAEIHVPVDAFLEGRHRGEALLRGLVLPGP